MSQMLFRVLDKRSWLVMGMVLAFLDGKLPLKAGELFEAKSGEHPPAMIELFTSEGCSSCPPAEEWLSSLKRNPRLWKDFVPVAFHVDYWDYLGWKDRWASGEFTARQRDYSRAWGSRSIYTPGFVLDGREWSQWGGAIPATKNSTALGLEVKETSPGVFALVCTGTGKASEKLVAHVSLLGFGINTPIAAGENAGRTLPHDFVVLNHQTRNLNEGRATIEIPHSSTTVAPRLAIAAWVSAIGEPKPLAVVGGWWGNR